MKKDFYTPEERSEYNKAYWENNKDSIREKFRQQRKLHARKRRLIARVKRELAKTNE